MECSSAGDSLWYIHFAKSASLSSLFEFGKKLLAAEGRTGLVDFTEQKFDSSSQWVIHKVWGQTNRAWRPARKK